MSRISRGPVAFSCLGPCRPYAVTDLITGGAATTRARDWPELGILNNARSVLASAATQLPFTLLPLCRMTYTSVPALPEQ